MRKVREDSTRKKGRGKGGGRPRTSDDHKKRLKAHRDEVRKILRQQRREEKIPPAEQVAQEAMAFGQKLKHLNRIAGITTGEVAEYMGVTRSRISQWKGGWARIPAHRARQFQEFYDKHLPEDEDEE